MLICASASCTEPCACGGTITVQTEAAYSIRAAVELHNRSFEHHAFMGNLWPHLCETCHVVTTIHEECHGCAGRIVGPLTVDALERGGLAPHRAVAA